MLNALRILRPQSHPLISPSFPSPSNLSRRTSGIRWQSSKSSDPMDGSQKKNPKEEHMASFGEGYATRSDEEGFGGVYGGNQQFPKKEGGGEDGKKAAEFDESQGSEVKEKEDSRHQKK